MLGYAIQIFLRKMVEPFAITGDPDQMPHSAVSEMSLHCLPITLLGVSRLQWVKMCKQTLPIKQPTFDTPDIVFYSSRMYSCKF